ncbi:tail completion protein gp17 [Aureimonas ureilytica]|uniref:tail completion protein gp17 n=1 Tax=Aureimonas ureilytica TaxID=401562 RepID=UPI003CF0BAD7
MRALADAIYARLAGDALLTASLGTWEGNPSIFTFRPVPDGAEYPIALAAEVVSDVNADAVTARGRQIVRDIAIYGKAESQFDAVEAAAERVRALFHRQPLEVDGFRVIVVTASGPMSGPAEPDEIGRIVTLTIRMDEAP